MGRWILTVIAHAALWFPAVMAEAIEIESTYSGGFYADGSYSPGFMNYYVGYSVPSSPMERRNWFLFDLTAVSGPVASGKLKLYLPGDPDKFEDCGYISPSPTEPYRVTSTTAPWPLFVDAHSGTPLPPMAGMFMYASLGTGTPYAVTTISVDSCGSDVVIDLTPEGVTAVNAALGDHLVMGGRLTDLLPSPGTPPSELAFAYTDIPKPGLPLPRLELVILTESPTPGSTPTATGIPTTTPTDTPTLTPTDTPTLTPTDTPTPAPTATPTLTATLSSDTPSPTATPIATLTPILPLHDSVVLARRPLTVRIGAGKSEKVVKVGVGVRNADTPGLEPLGHTIKLVVDGSGCPAGLAGTPDFDRRASGAQETATVTGRAKIASVALTVHSADFTTVNKLAPTRCVLLFTATAELAGGSSDPTPWNNVARLELNVIDENDTYLATSHESVASLVRRSGLRIVDGAIARRGAVRLKLTNADYLPSPETTGDLITVGVEADAACPGLGVEADCRRLAGVQTSATVLGGRSASCAIKLTADAALFDTPNPRSPQRCNVTLRATGPTDPETAPLDATNNATTLTVDVIDKNDF